MKRFLSQGAAFAAVCALAIPGLTIPASAQVVVTPSVTFSSNLFHYNYSVTNSTANDVLFVDVDTPKLATAAFNLQAPTGFQIAFDPGLGLVTFLEDTNTFSASPVSGFTFDSLFPSGATNFRATALDPGGSQITLAGATQGPVTPEPGSLALGTALAMSGLLAVRRRMRGKSISEQKEN